MSEEEQPEELLFQPVLPAGSSLGRNEDTGFKL